MKTNVQVNKYSILEMLTECVKTLVFVPNALSLLSRMYLAWFVVNS